MYPLWQRGPLYSSTQADKDATTSGGSTSELPSGTADGGSIGKDGGSIGNAGKYRRLAASVGDMSGTSGGRLYGGLSNGSYASGRKLWPKGDPSTPSNPTNGKPSLFNNIGNKTSSSSSSSLFPNKNSGLFNINSSNMPASSLNQQNNSLWNRRRTNSTINLPSSPVGEQDRSPSSKPAAKIFFANGGSHHEDYDRPTRGSSTSPRTPHSRGFWLQHPDDLHQQWVKTDTPDVQSPPATADSSASTLTWPRGASVTGLAKDSTGADARLAITEGDDADSSVPKTGDTPATLPRVYKSQATWMSSDGVANNGGGDGNGGGGGELMDLKSRMQHFQTKHKDNGRAAHNGDHSTSSSHETHQQQQQQQQQQIVKQNQQMTSNQQQQTQDQLQQHSMSMSNLSKLKSSMSEMKSSIDEMTSSNSAFSCSSNIQQASSSSVSSQSKIQSSSQSALSASNLKASQSTTALKSSKSSSTSSKSIESKSIKSSKSTNALQSNFLGSSEKLAEFGINQDQFALQNDQFDQNQLIEFKDPGELLLQDSSDLLNECDQQQLVPDQLGSSTGLNGSGVTTFEQKKVTSSSKRKVTTDNNSFETASGSSSQSTRVQAGDVTYSECQKQAAARSKMEKDGVTEEKEAALQQEARQLKAGDDITHTEGSQKMGASVRVMGQDFSSHKSAVSETNQRHTVTPAGTISAENSRKHSKSGLTITTKGVCTKQSSSMSSSESNISVSGFEDFDLGGSMQPMDVQNAIMKYSRVMTKFVDQLKSMSSEGVVKAPSLLDHMNDMMKRAWSVPTYGHELGYSLCNVLKNNGGLDILLENCTSDDSKLKFSSAKVLEQCLTTENRGYVVEKGLENVVNVACDCTQENRTIDQSRVGTGILEHLFKHSEGTCSDIIRMGGLEAVVRECRKTDVETLRHCAGALANLSLYGGSENQQAMVQRQVAIWLFPLAFHHDDNIKYYACLAIAALVANTEIEAQVLKADTLSLIEPFVNSHLPEEFANSTVAHRHGQSRDWLERLVPVLSSKREEARNLAAFHFCMEAGIKKNQGNLEIFREIDAIEPLKQVASSPNAIASKYAAHALRLMGEEVPHKLSQQVPLWQSNDVQEWVKQIGFGQYAEAFITSRVDGDLLLQIGEDNLTFDIGISNGILRQRFLRELRRLRQIADYSSKDPTALNSFMLQLGPEYAEYTYRMLLSGVTKQTLRYLSDDQLCSECGILNSIHRQRLKEGIIGSDEASALQDMNQLDKTLDVFISYRRSNGSQLASLLKVHMQLKNFSVFIDVERLEAGKFDNNLLNSIRQARNFLLVLTPNALDRCVGDVDCKDWVHKEIVAALESGCNIIPIIDNFHWPEPDQLPDDMRAVCYFNGVRWIHDYQDACVDKLERFMRGEGSLRGEPPGSLGRYHSTTMLTQPGTPSPLPRAQPIYQRTTSTESGKGSSCSDKDFTGKD